MTIELQDDIIELQSRVTFQEDMIASLNHQVAQHDADLAQIKEHVRLLNKKLNDLQYAAEQQKSMHGHNDQEKPPHY